MFDGCDATGRNRHRQSATERPIAMLKAVCRGRPRAAVRERPTATPAVGCKDLRESTSLAARPIVIQWDAYRGQPRPIPPAASPIAMAKGAYKAQRSKAAPEDIHTWMIAARDLGDFGNVNGEQLDERGVISDGNLNMRLVFILHS